MVAQSQFKFSPWILAVPLYFVLSLWLIYWFEVRNGYNFNSYGIYPRSFSGLKGIVLSPFIHGDIKHLYHNSAPLFVLLFSLLYFYRSIAWKVFIYGTLCAGLMTWIIARKSYHIGASGIVYGMPVCRRCKVHAGVVSRNSSHCIPKLRPFFLFFASTTVFYTIFTI